ncbi:MAG TPA: family 43 glycosylhydrolase [Fastidiosipila sp.]|nr:family 43 glycosylhydrolase [Fastidiosipila sp.]
MKLFCNPIKKHGDFADPFVLRYNGKYYLYATNPDIRCWSSPDLVEWKYEGPVIAEDTFPGLVPFAPEVTYWNGAFYMYTSPHGLGHYVLKSDNPKGPFEKISGNMGRTIDGSILIDDDGKWYFYWADDSGILGCEMKSPTEFGEPVNTGASMHGWTEGAMVVKENGLYYMTYTGNHYLSKGYRINAAISSNPLTGYKDIEHNPIIVNTEDPWVGLGHSSTVLGPDMLTRYIVYHNINPDRSRDLNIDPIVLAETVYVAGPCNYPQSAPNLPEFADDMAGTENWDIYEATNFSCVCKQALEANVGVIEFNLRSTEGEGSYGVNIDGLMIELNTESYIVMVAGEDYQLPWQYDHSVLHSLQVRYKPNKAILYIDGLKIATLASHIGTGSRIGYFSNDVKIDIGYTAFCAGDAKSIAEKLYYPVECYLPSRNTLRLNVPKAGEYSLATTIEEDVNENLFLLSDLSPTFQAASEDITIYNTGLPYGQVELAIENVIAAYETGRDDLFSIDLNNLTAYYKNCFGEIDSSEFETGIEFPLGGDGIGVIFHASELSDGGEGDDKELGKNFFIGYSVMIENDSIALYKHRYDEEELDRKYHYKTISKLRVKVRVNDFCVYVNDDINPLLKYHDNSPILWGRSGVRTKGNPANICKFYKIPLQQGRR